MERRIRDAQGPIDDIWVNSIQIGSTTITESELAALDATTAGTVTASLGVVVDANKDISGFRHVTQIGPVGTGTASASVLGLHTAETTVVDGDHLGRIEFKAPSEASGTDAILVGAAIWAEADDTFAAGVNDTDIVLATGLSEAATEKWRIDSGGKITQTLTSASTDGGSSVNFMNNEYTMTGAGGVGGRARYYMTTNVALGSWSNALKAEVTYGASGRTTGLGSAMLAEMTLSAGTSSGTYALYEGELNLGSGALTGTLTSLYHASVNGADAGTFDTNGYYLNLAGLTAGASNVFRTGLTAATINAATTAAIRIRVGATDYFIPLATATA